jgi:diguanylate cyclase (GGDEF)-like protein
MGDSGEVGTGRDRTMERETMIEAKSESSLFKADGVRRDGIIALSAIVIAFAVAVAFDLAGAWEALLAAYPQYRLDTLPVLALILAVVMAWFSFRRWRESNLTSTVRRRLNAHMEVLLSRESLRGNQLSEIKKMDEGLLAAEDSRQACEVALDHLRRIFAFGSGALFIVRKGLDNLAPIGGWGAYAHEAPADITACHCMALAPGSYHGEKALTRQASCGGCSLTDAEGVLCMPVTGGGKTYGVFQLAYGGAFGKLPSALKNRLEFDQMSALTAEVCRGIGRHLANVGLKRKLTDESMRDPLTGLLNRRGLERIAEHLTPAGAEGEAMAVMMMDVDSFKEINDGFGHDAGDSVLEFVGRTITEKCRDGDITCRFGGDEFLVALPAADIEAARLKGEAIRSAVANLGGLRLNYPDLNVTLSIGVAASPDDGADWEGLMAAADAALYTAKRQGRDRIASGTPALLTT